MTMSYCAYELDIDVTEVRKELLDIFYTAKKEEPASVYGDFYYRTHTNSFTEQFDDCILKKARLSRLPAGKSIEWHVDNNAANEDLHQWEGVPAPTAIPCTINILLSEPNGDVTLFGRPSTLSKFSITTPSWENKQEMTVIDSFTLGEKPLLINTDTMHTISAGTKDRILVSFGIWPGISWNSFVDYCRKKGVLIER